MYRRARLMGTEPAVDLEHFTVGVIGTADDLPPHVHAGAKVNESVYSGTVCGVKGRGGHRISIRSVVCY
jgi:hypothetical protein